MVNLGHFVWDLHWGLCIVWVGVIEWPLFIFSFAPGWSRSPRVETCRPLQRDKRRCARWPWRPMIRHALTATWIESDIFLGVKKPFCGWEVAENWWVGPFFCWTHSLEKEGLVGRAEFFYDEGKPAISLKPDPTNHGKNTIPHRSRPSPPGDPRGLLSLLETEAEATARSTTLKRNALPVVRLQRPTVLPSILIQTEWKHGHCFYMIRS